MDRALAAKLFTMSDYYQSNTTPDRPAGWVPDYSNCDNITDHNGVLLTVPKAEKERRDYKRLWDEFTARQRATRTMDITGQSQGIGERLAEHGERILHEKEI